MALARMKARLASRVDDPQTTDLVARIERLEGLLTWRLESEYHERLTDVNDHLLALETDVAALSERYDAFVRARQAATHSYVGYTDRISGLRERTQLALAETEALKSRQGERLEEVATAALVARRAQLAAYQNQARFAFADSYDRAAKGPAQ